MNNSTKVCPLCSGPGRFFYADERSERSYYRCECCELIWMAPGNRLSPEAELAHYQTHNNSPDDPDYRAFLSRLWEPLKESLEPGTFGLDYGSGPGPTLHLMAQEDGFSCTHYDPFFHPDESVLKGRYDFITCSETAEHFHHPDREFKRLADLLRPGGVLGIMTSMHTGDMNFADWHYHRDPTHVSFYSGRTFQFFAEKFGFKGVEFHGPSVVLLHK